MSANLDRAGRLRFIFADGRIARVKLDGNIDPASTQVLRFLDLSTEVRPTCAATLERRLLRAQDLSDVALRAVRKPTTDEPGARLLGVVRGHERRLRTIRDGPGGAGHSTGSAIGSRAGPATG